MAAKVFVPPAPAFSPRENDGTRPKTIPPPPPDLAGLNLDDDSSDEDDDPPAGGEKEYFGAGSYW